MKRALLICAVTAALSALAAPGAQGRAGDLDPTFSGDGRVAVTTPFVRPLDMAIDSKGRIVVLGVYVKTFTHTVVIRLNPDGSRDERFGFEGFGPREEFVAVETDAADRIVLGGRVASWPGSTWNFAAMRLLEDGRRDTTFAGDGLFTLERGYGTALALDDRGGLLLAGDIPVKKPNGMEMIEMAVLRVTSGGVLDPGFGSGGIAIGRFSDPASGAVGSNGRAVAVGPGGRIIVAGNTTPVGSEDFAVAAFDALGDPDPTLAGDGTARIDFGLVPSSEAADNVAVDRQGRIVLAGRNGGGFALAARLLPDGSPDPSFAGDGTLLLPLQDVSGVGGTAIDEAGRILLAGSTEGGPGRAFLVRLRQDGAFDDSFGAGGLVRQDFTALAASGLEVKIDSAGRYLIMGEAFSPVMGFGVARYLSGDSPSPSEPETKAPRCRGKRATIVGTGGSDGLRGTRGRDVVVALGGNDRIRTFAGRDLICAGSGRDLVRAGKSNDRVFGGPGKDRLFGGPGKDRLRGGPGRDVTR